VAGWWAWAWSLFLSVCRGAFDLAAGGGVVGSGVLLADAEAAQFGFEAVAASAAAGEAGGEHHAVVRERGGGWLVVLHGVTEGLDDDGAGDRGVGGDRQGVAGVVVEEGEDLGVGAVCEWVVGEVGLPALVRQLRSEPHIGRLGAFLRLRGHEAVSGQVAGNARP
jgi:hypothetical protein